MGSNKPIIKPVWPLDGNNEPTYPKTNGDEYYLKGDNNEDLILETRTGKRYARKKNGDEFYPKDKDQNDQVILSKYALNQNNVPIFPKTKDNDEFYVTDEYGSCVITSNGQQLSRYARTKLTEIYPFKFIDDGRVREVVLSGKYAVTHTSKKFYPLDEYGNEYTLNTMQNAKLDEAASFPDKYPITNDNYVILPDVLGKPYIITNIDPKVELHHIVGKLFRSVEYDDYFTTVKDHSKKSRGKVTEYKFLTAGIMKPVTWTPVSLTSPQKIEKNAFNLHWLWIVLFTFLGMIVFYVVFRK